MHRTLLTTLLLAALAAPARPADPPTSERLVVPLSDPARPARIEVGLVMGSISVVAGKSGEVVLTAAARADDEDEHEREFDHDPDDDADDRERARARAGMRRIPNNALGLEVEEKGNRVEIGVESWARAVDLKIEVPAASSVELSTVNDGDLSVEGIGGEIVLHNTNGEIAVRDVTGPVNASTVNGDVIVAFGRTMAAAAMAFSTLNGDVDVTLPPSARVDVLLRSDNGEIYSDFDIVLERRQAQVESDGRKGRYRIAIAQEQAGKIGGGGAEIFLKTFNGDILLRKAK
jgi:hypothetical protein